MPTPIIDAQVHCYEADSPRRPWVGRLAGPAEVSGDDMVAAMDETGVDGALLVSPWTMYRYDASYALSVYAKHPQRFGLIKPFDPFASNVEAELEQWANTAGAVGARIVLMEDKLPDIDAPGLNAVFAAGAKYGLPVNMICWGNLPLFDRLARRYPETQMVLDHLGLTQPFIPPVPAEPFADLEQVLALAHFDNVAIKISGACTLSHQAFPYEDIWSPLARIFEAFGIERCLWGTDWTRAINFLTFKQAVDAFRLLEPLSATERDALMGGNLARIYAWSPSRA